MTYIKRPDIPADGRAIADLGGGVQVRIERIIETTVDGVIVLLESGEVVTARSILKPEMVGMVVELQETAGQEPGTGQLVQVEYLIKPASASMTPVVHVVATWLDEPPDPDQRPIFVEFKHNASQSQQDTQTLPIIVRECLMLVMGEPLTVVDVGGAGNPEDFITLIPWDPELVQAVNIRRAIQIASESTAVDLDRIL